MATITPIHIDSFGHSYFTVTLGRGMYDATAGSLNTSTNSVIGQCSRSLMVDTTNAMYVQLVFSTGKRVVMTTFYVRFLTDLPAEDCTLFEFVNTNGNGIVGYSQAQNKLYAVVGGGTVVYGLPAGEAGLLPNRWYRVTAELDTTTGTASLRAVVDNGAEFTATNVQAANDTNSAALGRIIAVTTARTMLFSSWVLSETDGDYETAKAWRQHCVEDLRCTTDGTHNIATAGDFDSDTTTAFDNTSTTVHTYLDQDPFTGTPSANDNVREDVAVASRYVEVVFENPTVLPVIDGVRGVVTEVQDGGLGQSLQETRVFTSGGTEILRAGSLHLADSSVDQPGTLPEVYRRMLVAPGGTWDSSEVAGLKFRLGYATAAPIPHWWNTLVEVLSHQEAGGQTVQTIVAER